MRNRIVIVVVVILAIAAFWLLRHPSGMPAVPQPQGAPHISAPMPVPIAEAPVARATSPIAMTPLAKQPALPSFPKKTMPPKKVIPKPLSTPVVVAPVVPTPVIAPHRLVPVVPVPEELPQEWKGNNDSAIQHQGQVVIQTEKQWFQFWLEHHPGEGAPEVDFSKNMVVGVFLGVRPSDGFFVNIVNVHPDKNKLVVDFVQQDPPTGTFQVGVTAYPYDIKVIPRTPLKVTFQQLTPQDKR